MNQLEQLIMAWSAGEDCYYAIRDLLLELGYPKMADQHSKCSNPMACNLVKSMRGDVWPNLQDYLDSCEPKWLW